MSVTEAGHLQASVKAKIGRATYSVSDPQSPVIASPQDFPLFQISQGQLQEWGRAAHHS